MPLRKSKGNMYPWIDSTWNPIKGICPHQCSYCYMRPFWKQMKAPRLVEKELKTDLGCGNFIFVGSGIDMFAEKIPSEWIKKVLAYCSYFNNRYLFQSKNPKRFNDFINQFSKNTVLGTTIETNRRFYLDALYSVDRCVEMFFITYPKMVSIEPIMDFDLGILVKWIRDIKPEFVSIGADSKKHNLPEPPWEKVRELITELKTFTKVYEKDNLKRLEVNKKNGK